MNVAAAGSAGRALLVLAFAVASERAACQRLYYVEPGVAACPAAPPPATATPLVVTRGVAVPGSVTVACGFSDGSYTVSLTSSDPGVTFSPPTFLVNFGRVAGTGAFTVRFSTPGVQRIAAHISPNMGSPAVKGYFASATSGFQVVSP